MPEPRQIHRATTRVMSTILVVLGVAMIATTIANDASVLALGVLLGVLFIAAGLGRLYLSTRGG